MLEPVDGAELVADVLGGEQPHRPTRLRHRQLGGVAGEQDLRAVPYGDQLDRSHQVERGAGAGPAQPQRQRHCALGGAAQAGQVRDQ